MAAAHALARFEALLSPPGQALLAHLKQQDITPGSALQHGTKLRARYPVQLVGDGLTQHELRLRARAKFGRAMDMFFTRSGLEQASSDLVASYRAGRYEQAGRLADLCCGIGGDVVALAEGHEVVAVDRDALHLRIARANADALGVGGNVAVVEADVREVNVTGVDAVFIDPARRADRGRLRTGESAPALAWCAGLASRVGQVGIKAAPGLPREAVPPDWELEFIAVGRDMKEAVAWSPALAAAATRATVLPGGHTMAPKEGGAVEVRLPGAYLFDPNPAVTRAGAVEELARTLPAWKIDRRIAFLSSDTLVTSPFARTLRVIDSAPWNQKRLPARLRALDIGVVDIRRRGLAGDVPQLRRLLKLSGSRRATLVMTRADDRPWGLVCLDVDQSAGLTLQASPVSSAPP